MEPLTILIGDDHPLCRQATRAIVLSRWPECEVLQAGTFDDVLVQLSHGAESDLAKATDLVVLDLAMPDRRGLAGLLAVLNVAPDARILVYSGNESPGLCGSTRALGASGFVAKAAPVDELILAIDTVLAGGEYFPQTDHGSGESGAMATLSPRLADLSTAERRVLGAICDGSLNKQVAYQLNLSEITVKQHVKAILRKLGVANRTQAALVMQFHSSEMVHLI